MQPGDSGDAVRGRRAFLAAGHFDRLSDQVNEAVATQLTGGSGTACRILDAGCGEGFYLRRLRERLPHRPESACTCWGVDISRPAISLASRADRAGQYAVGSTFRLPVLTGAIDVAYRVFAPSDAAQLRRVLRPDGRLVVVMPGPHHLQSLRHLVYESPREHSQEPVTLEGFRCLGQTRLTYPLRLRDPGQVQALVAMTPYRWHVSAEMSDRLGALDRLDTDADFLLAVYAMDGDPVAPCAGSGYRRPDSHHGSDPV